MKVLSFLMQIANYTVFMYIVWFFSANPSYQHTAPDQAVIALSFSHAGQPISECRKRTEEELADLPPNMRAPMDCPRQRSPIEVELSLDDKVIFHDTFAAKGASGDWGIDVFKEFPVPVGNYNLKMKLKDSIRVEDYNHKFEKQFDIKPRQLVLVDFKTNQGFSVK